MNRTIKLIKLKSDDFYRLQYRINLWTITSSGFRNKKEMCKVIMQDNSFKLEDIVPSSNIRKIQ